MRPGIYPEPANGPVRPENVQTAIVLVFVAAHASILGAVSCLFDGSRPIPAAALEPMRFDPNGASAAELELLPGIGPTLAARIIEYRTTSGTIFERPSDLDAVNRIGPAMVERITPYLRFEKTVPRAGSP